MNFITKILLKGRSIKNPESKSILGYWEAGISIVLNLIISFVKFYLGFLTGSIALKGDALHTLSDTLTSLVVLVGIKLSSIPPDKEHPHGHGRMEWLSSLAIALLLVVTGTSLFLTSYKRISSPSIQEIPGTIFIFILLFFSLLKELLFRLSFFWGKNAEISSLIGDAYHHRTDAFASLLVITGLLLQRFNFIFLDGVLGIIISFFIIKVGFDIVLSSTSLLLGKKGNATDLEIIEELVFEINGVKEVHKIEIHDFGNFKDISLHILLNGKIPLDEAHNIAQEVEDKIKKVFFLSHITVHTEPYNLKQDSRSQGVGGSSENHNILLD